MIVDTRDEDLIGVTFIILTPPLNQMARARAWPIGNNRFRAHKRSSDNTRAAEMEGSWPRIRLRRESVAKALRSWMWDQLAAPAMTGASN